MLKWVNKTKIGYVCLITFIASLLLCVSYFRTFDDFEYSMLDFRYRLRPLQKVNDDIVIIEIDDNSIKQLGRWPFIRNYHALLVKILGVSGADTIVFDVFFSEGKKEDEEFARAIKNAGIVYLPYIFELEKGGLDHEKIFAAGFVAPLVEILKKDAKGTGFINLVPDNDGKIRNILPYVKYKGKNYPQLAVLAALNDLGYRFDEVEIVPGKRIAVSDGFFIPLNEDSSMMINYPSEWEKSFKRYSFVKILQSYLSEVTGQKPEVNLGDLKGKKCFVGLTASTVHDTNSSPMQNFYPGVGINASVYNSIANHTSLKRLNRWWNLAVLIFLWGCIVYITGRVRKRFGLLSIFFIIACYIGIAMVFFYPFGIWVDVFFPLISGVVVYVIFTFKKYVTEIQKRELIEKELDIAKDIQRSFLPKEVPVITGMDIDVEMVTARQVGGDLYDIVPLKDNKVGIMIGDVSGKGVPAALYMARVVSVFKTFIRDISVGEILKNVNERLVSEDSDTNLFVTLTYMIFDVITGSVTYAIGGHLPTILVDPDGNVEFLNAEDGMPLGLMSGNFPESTKKYKKGSIFLLYTDGITEAMNTRKEMFGQERIIEVVKGLKDCNSRQVVEALHKAVEEFTGKAAQHDDITVIAICT
ncbi:MAG: CHASE2 domain-containing protein [Candidatus Omnitrophota bacterium]